MDLDNNVEIMEESRQNPNEAILHSHIDAIKDVLEGGAHVNARNKAGETALHIAAGAGQLETVKFLLKHGADVKAETNLKLTALHIAVRNGNAKLAKFLTLHCYSMIDSSDHTGNTPLYDAVKSGNLEIVKTLLKADADPNIHNNDGDSPFLLALTMGKENLVLLLMEYGAKLKQKTAKGEGVMHLACRYCNDTIINGLIGRKLSVHSVTLDGSSTLHYAVMNKDYTNRLSCVSLMLRYGVKPDVVDNNNCSPIMIAAKKRYCCVIRELMLQGASLSIADSRTGLTPLMMAVKQGSCITAHALMNERWQSSQYICASIRLCDHNQENVLHLAIKHLEGVERVFFIQDLIRNSVDVKQRSIENKTPIDLILETKNQVFIYEMLDTVDFDEKRDILDYNALLMIALERGSLSKTNLMLVKGAQAENPCFIVTATKSASPAYFLRKLIKYGADVNAVDETGNSILELAIEKQLTEIVDLLLLFGADINRVNHGRTPLLLATYIMKENNCIMESVANVLLLLRRIALMQHQGKCIHELNRQVIQKSRITDSKKFTTVIEIYNNVLESMRDIPVTDDTPMTYYDLIVRPNSELIGAYAGNKKLRAAARTCIEGHVLIQFSDVLQIKYTQCLQRKNLVRVVRPSLHKIFHSKLPYELTCEIVDYMSNNDMRRYVKLAFPKIERNRQLDW